VNAHPASSCVTGLADRDGVQLTYGSSGLLIVRCSSAMARLTTDSIRSQVGPRNVRYYLSAGDDQFGAPAWTLGCRRRSTEPATRDRSAMLLVRSILHGREHRAELLEQEVRAMAAWYGDGGDAEKCVVLEFIGLPGRDDLAFVLACRMRVNKTLQTVLPAVLVVHDEAAEPDRTPLVPAQHTDEVLLTLLLSGGYVWASDIEQWSTLRGWSDAAVAAATSTRATPHGVLFTYADNCGRPRAWAALRASAPTTAATLAAMVVSGRAQPSIATASLVPDPALALRAFSAFGCAVAGHDRRRSMSSYARTVFRSARAHGWRGAPKAMAGTVVLAAVISERKRVTAAESRVLLNLAESFGIDAQVRARLAYCLGQMLARDSVDASWAESIRCSEYVSRCLTTPRSVSDGNVVSQMAASYNGAALARFRSGDLPAARAAESAALDAIASAAMQNDDLGEQQILLLANLAKVHDREGNRPEALACYHRAWHGASRVGSLEAMAYVGPSLTRDLLSSGRKADAEAVGRTLIASYRNSDLPHRKVERAIAASCFALADADLEEGATDAAGEWYVEAVDCTHQPVPQVIDAIIGNLGRQAGAPPAAIVRWLDVQARTHRTMAQDVDALVALADGGRDGG